ncbi:hypothetical protein [Haloplanus salinus]|jgi:hypothetical protein|nr:hypothetical protein [Haloplanus salinus]
MDPDDFPTPDEPVAALSAADLESRPDAGEVVTILDARAVSDVEA